MRVYKHQYPQPMVGKQYGDLTVIAVERGPRGGIISVRCRCKCGLVSTPHRCSLTSGASTRCPTCRIKIAIAARVARTKYAFVPTTHRNRLRECTRHAIDRCSCSAMHNYARYGGRGISVYPAWREDQTLFVRYLMTLPGWDDPILEIDRIDNDGNYEPGNLRWVTRSENQRNKS